MDTYSGKTVGWTTDSAQDTNLVINTLDIPIRIRKPETGGIVHADHGTQFTSWAFTDKIRASGLIPSLGTVGDCYNNSMIESFWSSMQIELFKGKKRRTKADLANAMFE
ncbi:transposase InsO family protein [Arthrobacter sp. CAN_C5]|nr:transposase InsO family protein [Arthrobacter sp. CAN_C5]